MGKPLQWQRNRLDCDFFLEVGQVPELLVAGQIGVKESFVDQMTGGLPARSVPVK